MKKYLKFLVLTMLLFTVKTNAQLTISGPTSIQLTNNGVYTATSTANLTGYTFVWSVNNTNATLSGTGASITLTGATAGFVTLSVVAFKDATSPIYCDDYSITIKDPCDNGYRITALACSNNVNPNGWTFQLTNNGSPAGDATAVWNSGVIPTHFIVDSGSGGLVSGHPIPQHVIPSGETNPNPVYGFTVTCTYNGCTYVYEYSGNYGSCAGGRSGYIDSNGTFGWH